MIMKIDAIFSSFCNALIMILNAFIIALLMICFIVFVFVVAVVVFLILYLEINDCRFHVISRRNCWLSLSNWLIDKPIMMFIIFWTSNRLLFLMTLIESETFNSLSIINFFTCSFTILIFALSFFFAWEIDLSWDIIIDSSSKYSIIFCSFFSSSNSWNSSDWFILDIIFMLFDSFRLSFFSWRFTYLSCSSFILSFLFRIVLFFLTCWV